MASIIKVDQIETDVNLTGSASAPSLYPMNDTNTGVFFPAADTVAISTGGTERLRVNSSGNLVVTGTTSLSNVTVSGTVSTNTGTLTLPTITGNLALSTKTVQVFTSGSGTYTTPAGCRAIFVRMVGGGSSGATYLADNVGGGATTFGSSFLTCNGASAGTGGQPGAGGTATGGDINFTGAAGGAGTASSAGPAGSGGSSPFGGGGIGGTTGQAGGNAATNSGSGGGGGAVSSSVGRAGGSAGGYLEKLITSPSATYSYAIGAGGSGVSNAGNGGAGIIIVQEFY